MERPLSSHLRRVRSQEIFFSLAQGYLFRGRPTLRSQFRRYAYSHLSISEQPISLCLKLCSIVSEDINNLIQLTGNRMNVAIHL